MDPMAHGPKISMDSIDFLGHKALNEIRLGVLREIHLDISHAAHGVFKKAFFMEPTVWFQENTEIQQKGAIQKIINPGLKNKHKQQIRETSTNTVIGQPC